MGFDARLAGVATESDRKNPQSGALESGDVQSDELTNTDAACGAVVVLDASSRVVEVLSRFGTDVRLIGLSLEQPPPGIHLMRELSDDHSAEKRIAVLSLEPVTDHSVGSALVIDDERLNRDYYSEILTSLGWTVTTAADSSEGVKLFSVIEPDVVFVDVRLPDRNGYETARRIRVADRGRAYIVLMSADPQMVEHERTSNAGADLALVGPIAPAQVQRLVESGRTRPTRRRQVMSNESRLDATSSKDSAFTSPAGRLRLRVFGGVQLRPDLGPAPPWLPCPTGRNAELMAALVSHHPETVNAADLAELAWDNQQPTAGAVYTAVSRLRVWLDSVGCGNVVSSSSAGYSLDLAENEIDCKVFMQTAMHIDLSLEPEEFVERATELLQLATGSPYHGCSGPAASGDRLRIVEAQAVLEERLATNLILCHRSAEAIAVIRDLAQREMWRERAWAILSVALYSAGRQREALEVFRAARTLLVNSVGVDPGPQLRETERLVLDQSPKLDDPLFIKSLAQ